MAGETKTSDAFEAALKREMQHPSRSGNADCPAPEVLAAYYDRSLSRAERARVDTHLLACPRCQSMMAAMVRADDSPSVASSRREAIYWITRVATPIAAIAATIAFAVGLHHRASPPPEVIALASPAAVQPQAQAPAPPASMELPMKRPQPEAGSLVARNLSEPHPAALARAKAAQPSEVAKSAPLAARAEFSAGPSAGAAAVSGSSAGYAIVKPRVYRVASPDGSVVWRFGSQGLIFLSDNSAKDRVVRQTGGELLAGAAPSDDVCWIVGKSGIILRTRDRGAHWQIIKPPLDSDFSAIAATDSNNATITTASGQRYITRDGGVTWSAQ